MNNLTLLNSHSFRLTSDVNSSVLLRAYEAKINRANHVILRYLKNGQLIDLGPISNVTIDGSPATFEAIRRLVFNFSCVCGDDENPFTFKIFFPVFDNTFI